MIRDTFFSAPRFVNLCRKEMVESWKSNLLRFVMMYGLMAIAFVWIGYFSYGRWVRFYSYDIKEDPMWEVTLTVFIAGIIIMGMLSASFMMERMKTKVNRISVLMTPATSFEKFFSRWMVFTFGFLLVFILSFKLADWTRVLIYMVAYPESEVIAPMPISYLRCREMFEDCRSVMLSISLYLFAQSIFVLGSSVWPRGAFVKTLSAVVVIIVVYALAGVTLAKMLFENRSMYGLEQPMSDETMSYLVIVAFFLMALFNWVVAYFRFKESEIINRW